MSTAWLNWLSNVDLAVELAVIGRLIHNGLFRIYRFFFAYLAIDTAETILGRLVSFHSNLYAYIYLAGQSVKMAVAVFVVLEVYQVALEPHPALARFVRTSAGYILLAAAAIAVLGSALDRSVPPRRSAMIHHFNRFERTLDLWMLLLLGLIAIFITWFPVPLKRNAVLYVGGFMFYFLSRSGGLLMINLTPDLTRPLDALILAAAILCALAWFVSLTREGEEITTVVGHRWHPAEAARLAGQLQAINNKLLRLNRR